MAIEITKQEIVDAFTLFLSGAAQFKNEGEMLLRKDSFKEITIKFPESSPTNALVKIYWKFDIQDSNSNMSSYSDAESKQEYSHYKLVKMTEKNGAGFKTYEMIKRKKYTITTTWHTNGKKDSEMVVDKFKEKITCWYKSGKLRSIEEYSHDILVNRTEWHNNGQLKLKETPDILTTWFANGKKSRLLEKDKEMLWNSKGEKVYEQYKKDGWLITKRREGH